MQYNGSVLSLTYDEYKEYVKGTDTIAPGYFNVYNFEDRKDAQCRWRCYVGIHKQNNGIEKRLNTRHESFSWILFNLVLLLDIGSTTDFICAYTTLDSLKQEIIRERTNPLIIRVRFATEFFPNTDLSD